MSTFFDQAAPQSAVAGETPADRAAKWLVGDRLACVLHLGDAALAYRLSDQGHDVTVAGPDVRGRRDPHVAYVRTHLDHLPFATASFDAVIASTVHQGPGREAAWAGLLRPGGLVSTITRSDDESIPWLRRLRDVVGRREQAPEILTLRGAMFEPVEEQDIATWERLDRAGLQQYARSVGRSDLGDVDLSRVNELFSANAGHTGYLRLRQVTTMRRWRVDPRHVQAPPPADDPMLVDLR